MAARAPRREKIPGWLAGTPSPMQFFAKLKWIDNRPLLDTIEEYRRAIFTEVLWSFDGDRPRYSLALCGRGKKNYKTSDLTLAGLYRFLIWPSAQGNDSAIVASDEDQAADDLSLVKKLIAANPVLDKACEIRVREIVRRDDGARLRILPAGDAAGLHGKTYAFLGYDELHTATSYNVLEALAADPTRRDALTWMTSYASIFHRKGVPLYDFMELGKAGSPGLYFSWYGADYSTDPDFTGEHLTGEQRANPSMASWDNPTYLVQQKARLPSPQYRRLHLNLPGAPEGAAFDSEAVMAAVVTGRRILPYDERFVYHGAVDMSGGSHDNACLAIVHLDEDGRVVLDLLVNQGQAPPFVPREAVTKFARHCKDYHCYSVWGDQYAGRAFSSDFEARGVAYHPILQTKHSVYQALEAPLLSDELRWLDMPVLVEETLGLVYRSAGKIDHPNNGMDDHINAVAIATFVARAPEFSAPIVIPFVATNESHPYRDRWAPDWSSGGIYGGDTYTGSSAWVRERGERGY